MRALILAISVGMALAAAPAAGATTVATGWIRNTVVTQQSCLSMAQEVGQAMGFTVRSDGTSVALEGPSQEIVVIQCDAAPHIFFVAAHGSKPAAEITALCDAIETRLAALIDARP